MLWYRGYGRNGCDVSDSDIACIVSAIVGAAVREIVQLFRK